MQGRVYWWDLLKGFAECSLKTCCFLFQQIRLVIEIELAYMNTNHPDFVGFDKYVVTSAQAPRGCRLFMCVFYLPQCCQWCPEEEGSPECHQSGDQQGLARYACLPHQGKQQGLLVCSHC